MCPRVVLSSVLFTGAHQDFLLFIRVPTLIYLADLRSLGFAFALILNAAVPQMMNSSIATHSVMYRQSVSAIHSYPYMSTWCWSHASTDLLYVPLTHSYPCMSTWCWSHASTDLLYVPPSYTATLIVCMNVLPVVESAL